MTVRARSRRAAFTLLELVLSMGIVAMIALTLYAAMRVGFRGRDSAEAQTAAARPAAIVLDLLQSDFDSVPLPGGKLAGAFVGSTNGAGDGAAATVTFVCFGQDATPPDAPFADGLRRVQLTLHSDGPQPLLVRRVWRNLLAPSPLAPEEEVLARGVHAFSVLYYDGSAWHASWDSTLMNNALPQAVQISLELDRPTRDGARPYRMSRIVPLACKAAPPADDTEAPSAAATP